MTDYVHKITDLFGTPTVNVLGTGIDNTVNCSIIDVNGVYYIGGRFTTAGGDADCNHIAYYDIATSNWKPLATGLNNTVRCFAIGPDGYLYVGGSFTDAAYPYLCYWDGNQFNPVNIASDINGAVLKILFDKQGNLIVGGLFTNAGGVATADCLAKWDGNKWSDIGGGGIYRSGGGSAQINDIAVDNAGQIYITGYFTAIGNMAISHLAVYSNGAWRALNIDLPIGTVLAYGRLFIASDGSLYVSGEYTGTTSTAIAPYSTTVNNTGNANTYPKIVVVGPGVLEAIRNGRNNKSVLFNGLTLHAGETITINLDPTNLYMVSSWEGRGNVLRYVAAGSDYGNFALEPGENYINIYMPSGTTSASGGYMTYTPRFWNIEGAIYE